MSLLPFQVASLTVVNNDLIIA